MPPCPSTAVTWYLPRDLPTQATAVARASPEVWGCETAVSERLNAGEESPGFGGFDAWWVFSDVTGDLLHQEGCQEPFHRFFTIKDPS
jgi:hypothetical protein